MPLYLRYCSIVAAILASVSAKTTVIDMPSPEFGEEDGHHEFEEANTARALASRIVGGYQAPSGKYPYFVQWERGCGASLIHADILLTAAHCNGNSIPTGVIVSAYQTGKAINGAQARIIVDRVQHPNYNYQTNVNDFLIMRLDASVTGVIPVALNADPQIPADGDVLTVMGFGDMGSGSQTYPEFLQEVDVPFVAHSKCNAQYGGTIDATSMICAGLDQGGMDSCQGDSGGPIVRIINGVHTQVGVVSWGEGCALAGKPGVYARTSAQIKWIQSEVCRLTKTNPKPAYCTPTTNNTPTRAPTRGPTRGPTRTPTGTATRAPTRAPTTASGGTCVDDPTAAFAINGKQRNCAWFASRPTIQLSYCGRDSEPNKYCQKTCNSCVRSKFDAACKDSANKFWINDRLGFKTCAWLATDESWQSKVCGWENELDIECQSTCKSCEYYRKKAQ